MSFADRLAGHRARIEVQDAARAAAEQRADAAGDSGSPPSATCPRAGDWRSPAPSGEVVEVLQVIGMPARRAIATRWIIALVEPPSRCARRARSRPSARSRMSRRLQILPHHLDDAPAARPQAMRGCAASAAGIEAAPGSVRPSASAIDGHGRGRAHRHAGAEPSARCRPPCRSIAGSVMLPASFSAQYFQMSDPEPRILPPKLPRIIGPAGMKIDRQVHADARP